VIHTAAPVFLGAGKQDVEERHVMADVGAERPQTAGRVGYDSSAPAAATPWRSA
jgi:hypothetical protein